MLRDSFRLREIVFAYLIGPPRPLDRAAAKKLDDCVCDSLGYQDFGLEFSPPPAGSDSHKFTISITRNKSPKLQILLQGENPNSPMVYRVTETEPSTAPSCGKNVDAAVRALWNAVGEMDVVLVEARVIGQCNSGADHARNLFRDRLLKIDSESYERLEGPVEFVGLEMKVGRSKGAGRVIDGPRHEVKLEILQEDPRDIFVNVMLQWSQIKAIAPGAMQIQLKKEDVLALREQQASEFLTKAVDYTLNSVLTLPDGEIAT
jgi:hypothetical protein